MDRYQYRMLKSFCDGATRSASDLDICSREICDYLLSCGYLRAASRAIGKNYKTVASAYVIAQAGRSAIYDFRVSRQKRWIPIAISIVALVISAASFMYSILS